jgi:spore germination protein KC
VAVLIRKALAAVLCLASILTTTGCWDVRDPRNRAFVTAIGLDLAEDGALAVTFQIPATGQLRGSAGAGIVCRTAPGCICPLFL